MKDALTSFDAMALVAEFQDLVGGFVDKVYQTGDEIMIRLNLPGRGRAELYCRAGKWLCLHEVPAKPESPTPFATVLRKSLDNARILKVEQHGFDRVVTFTLDRSGEAQLVFELFGKGNVVLVREGNTMAALHTLSFKSREVKPGKAYGFPPVGTNPLELDRETFHSTVRGAKGPIVKVLAGPLNLGGTYAEELCLRGGLDKSRATKDLTATELDALYTALNNVVAAVEQDRQPAVIVENGQAIDATPIELLQHAGKERRRFGSFNEALSSYLREAPAAEAVDPATAKLQRRIEQQEETLRTLRSEEARLGALAVFLYGHFQVLSELLLAVREDRAFDQVQISSIDRARGTVTIAIGDWDAVELDYAMDVQQNIQAMYERRRDAKEKAERVVEAIAATRVELEAAQRKVQKAARRPPRAKPTKRFWFEAYRWCLSSEGFLMLGGRDAKTNDAIGRKHLAAGDRYAHADLRGAPSVVVKEGASAGEATLREACAFALLYSKAWPAGLSSGSAFWVTPDQVSKEAESGEYLPRGAFMVRGKRNYAHDIAVEAAAGEVLVEGHRKVMGGPPSAVLARATRYIMIRPGEMPRARLVHALARSFDVPDEEVDRVFPPGRFAILRSQGVDVPLEKT